MPQVSQNNLSDLHAIITVSVPRSEYQPIVEKKMKDFSKQADIKGFRKGQVPMAYIRARFGQAIMAEEVQELLSKTLEDYLNETGKNYLGYPIPAENQSFLDLNVNKMEDVSFSYEVGWVGDYEIQGISDDVKFNYYEIPVKDADLDLELEGLARNAGTYDNTVTSFEAKDSISVTIEELVDGNVKEGGILKEDAYFLPDAFSNETIKNSLLGLGIGDKFKFKAEDVSKNLDSFRKYVLGIEDGVEVNDEFQATITQIRRFVPGEITQEILNEAFGPEVNTIEEAKETLRTEFVKSNQRSAEVQLCNDIMIYLVENNKLPLPEIFVKRWMTVSDKTGAVTPENVEEKYQDQINSLTLLMIEDRIAAEQNIQVTEQDIQQDIARQVYRYLRSYANEELFRMYYQKLAEDKNYVRQRRDFLRRSKVLEYCATLVGRETKQVTMEEFQVINQLADKRAGELLKGGNDEPLDEE